MAMATAGEADGLDDANCPVRYAVTPTIDPTDRSMLRVTMTRVWATARTAVIATLVVTRLKKRPLK
jgi:hypothetical protein